MAINNPPESGNQQSPPSSGQPPAKIPTPVKTYVIGALVLVAIIVVIGFLAR